MIVHLWLIGVEYVDIDMEGSENDSSNLGQKSVSILIVYG